jgi:hypothetical protein
LLLDWGAPFDLFGALALERADEARRILEGAADLIPETHRPESLLAMVVSLIGTRIVQRTRVGPSYRRDRAASGIPTEDEAVVKAAVAEDLDLLDLLIARGALRYPSYDAVYMALELPDPTVAERLLEAGAERTPGPRSGNLLPLRYAAGQSACKERMLALLGRYQIDS